jgi:hypothetical protein
MAYKSPPFRGPHERLKQVGDHYAIKLHPSNKSAFACILIYSWVLFCDGLFYDDSLLWTLSSLTKHSQLVVRHCRNSSILSLLSELLAVFRCACVLLFYFSAVLLSWLWYFHLWHQSKRQKRRKNQNSWHYILSRCLLNHSLRLLQQNKKLWDWFFLITCVNFCIHNSLN